MKQFCKYFLIVILFLLPGIITSCVTDSSNVVAVPEENSASVAVLSDTVIPISTVYAAMSDVFSTIRLVKTLKVSEMNSSRDFFKILHTVFKYEADVSPQAVCSGNFMRLLSERYYQGFYIYFRKLVI